MTLYFIFRESKSKSWHICLIFRHCQKGQIMLNPPSPLVRKKSENCYITYSKTLQEQIGKQIANTDKINFLCEKEGISEDFTFK